MIKIKYNKNTGNEGYERGWEVNIFPAEKKKQERFKTQEQRWKRIHSEDVSISFWAKEKLKQNE